MANQIPRDNYCFQRRHLRKSTKVFEKNDGLVWIHGLIISIYRNCDQVAIVYSYVYRMEGGIVIFDCCINCVYEKKTPCTKHVREVKWFM